MSSRNDKQKAVAKSWRGNIRTFLLREWKVALTWGVGGALLGISLQVAFTEKDILAYVKTACATHGITRSRLISHSGDLKALLLILVLGSASFGTPLSRRIFRSWIRGSASGVALWTFLCTVVLFLGSQGLTLSALAVYAILLAVFLALSFMFYQQAQIEMVRTLTEAELRVRADRTAPKKLWTSIGDEPINTWEDDILGRAALVDIITNKTLVAKAPVVALTGPLGVGKSSVLNLLQKHLEDKAIVLRFITWLPGSQDVLSSYLLADIATECQKRYVVPGLRRSTRRVARALAEAVPTLKGLLELLPATTQRDDIKALAGALARLPERVVVLLDELDRMEKEEILTLMKVLRGLTALPNCSFVCALDLDEIMQTVRASNDLTAHIYFEKFFPIKVPMPRLDAGTLQQVGVERITGAFDRESWFAEPKAKHDFETELTKVWKEMVAPLCGTLRSIGLLAMNIDVAAALLSKQVEPLDLTLIEALRQFRPQLYELVARNKLALTGGESWLRGGLYISDDRKKHEEESFKKELETELAPNDVGPVKALLKLLFPKFAALDGRGFLGRPEKHKSYQAISDPEMFSAYFQFELPEGVFSSRELDEFITAFRAASDDAARKPIYAEFLRRLPKQSMKRDDFLRRLSDLTKDLSQNDAERLALTAVAEAREYTYDMFAGFGEAGHVIRIVIRAAEKMEHDQRVSFLKRCILIANDDTLAVRILSILTNPKTDVRLDVTNEELRPAFMDRMRRQYGPGADAQMDLSTSDPEAFLQWGWTPPDSDRDTEDRRMQQDFWVRRIGQSRKKLAEVFDMFLMPRRFAYTIDPAPVVEQTLPISTLERLLNELPDDEELDEQEKKAFVRMRHLVAGDYKNGVPMVEGE